MATEAVTPIDTKVVATLLRGLALDVESSPELASRIVDAFLDLGLFNDAIPGIAPDAIEAAPADVADKNASAISMLGLRAARIDLLAIYHSGGPEQLRQRLSEFDISSLRRIIRVRQLDPEKKTTKLRSISKLADFIIECVAAQVERERELSRSASWML